MEILRESTCNARFFICNGHTIEFYHIAFHGRILAVISGLNPQALMEGTVEYPGSSRPLGFVVQLIL